MSLCVRQRHSFVIQSVINTTTVQYHVSLLSMSGIHVTIQPWSCLDTQRDTVYTKMDTEVSGGKRGGHRRG